MIGTTLDTRSGNRRLWPAAAPALAGLSILLAACEPTVRVEAPDRPIEINLNVRIEQEVLIRIDRQLENVFTENDDIF